MKNVLCPRCKTEHRLANDASGYTCSGCGTGWVFAKCAQCHSTFHAPAHTASWTCKRCGFRNVSEATPPPETVAEEPDARPSLLDQARTRWNALTGRAKLIAIVVPIGIIGIVAGLALSGGGSGGPSGTAAALQSYCQHEHNLAQEFTRAPAVRRFAKQIKQDAAAFKAAGDTQTAKELKTIVQEARALAAKVA